jgi:predicted 3-demethylubiquinone-9 3-methyltransferase (glyoxalase superfamily)
MMSANNLTTCLWFDGKAEEAARHYTSVLPQSSMGHITYAPADYPSGKQGDVLTVDFTLMGRSFMGLNGGPNFTFNEAVSLMVPVETQEESERLYKALSGVPEAEQCGWVKDRFGLSWQIVPVQLIEAMNDPDPARVKRAFEAMMHMKRIDIAAIEAAVRG